MKIQISAVAYLEMAKISFFIVSKGYPETAHKFYDRMINFANSLADFPFKHAICRFSPFAKRNYHCAVFEENYIFVYKIEKNELFVLRVVSTKIMKS